MSDTVKNASVLLNMMNRLGAEMTYTLPDGGRLSPAGAINELLNSVGQLTNINAGLKKQVEMLEKAKQELAEKLEAALNPKPAAAPEAPAAGLKIEENKGNAKKPGKAA